MNKHIILNFIIELNTKNRKLNLTIILTFLLCILYGQNDIDERFKGGENGFRTFLYHNLSYPAESVMNLIAGLSVSSISITPEGEIEEINIINSLDKYLDSVIVNTLKATEKKWLKSEQDSVNQIFYVQIGCTLLDNIEFSGLILPSSGKNNFIEPVYMTIIGVKPKEERITNDELAEYCSITLKEKDYKTSLLLINELIRRNPYKKGYYNIRILICRKLKMNDIIVEDSKKVNNFIPGVSLEELISDKN